MQRVALRLPPLKNKQQLVYESKATEILLGGDTRSGKSFFIRWAYIHYAALIPGIQMDIFRLHFDDVIGENMEGETSFPMLLDPWVKADLVKINQTEVRFWNGSLISLESCNDDTVLLKHRGIAKHVRTFGESTQILEHRIRALTGWVTMSDEMKSRVPAYWKGLFPKVYHVTNPTGVSAGYYRKNFVDCRTPYSIEPVGQFQRQYIPMFLDDNDAEDAAATKARIIEAFPDEAIQKAFINEDKSGISNWHTGGGEFFPEWDRKRHVVPDFVPPAWWFHYRSEDIGWSEPCAVYYIAVSDGYPFRDTMGRERWFPRGARIFYRELYLCDARNPAKGLGLSNKEMAQRILQNSELQHRRVPTLTDSKPFQGAGSKTPATEFAEEGVELTQVNTGPGSRVAGWSIMRSALIGQVIDGFTERLPMVYFCECCVYAAAYIPALPRHPSEGKKEDAAESGEATHSCDAVRYGLLGHEVVNTIAAPLTQERLDKEIARTNLTIQSIVKKSGIKFFK
jgi:hypothetical protein